MKWTTGRKIKEVRDESLDDLQSFCVDIKPWDRFQ
jgi:hypothetical protein